MYWNSGIEYIEKTVTWNWYVDLLTAKNWSLSNLTLFWWMKQDDTDVLQSVVLDWATVQRNVPEWYTELDYLRNVQGATKFNTWLTPLVWDEIEIVRTAWTTNQSNYLLQSRESTNTWIWWISWSQSWSTILCSWWAWQSVTSNITRTISHKYYTKMSVTATTLTLTVKDLTDNLSDTQVNSSITAEDWATNYYIRWNSVQTLNPIQNVYYARISNNGVDRIRLIPAKQWDTVWFYDMVSQTFMSTFIGDEPIESSAEATVHPYIWTNIVSNNGALKVSRNLFDMSKAERGDIASATWIISTTVSYRIVSDYIPVQVGQSYTASGKICFEGVANEYDVRLIIAFYDSSKAYISASRTTSPLVLTVPDNWASYIRVEYWGDQSTGYTVDTDRSKLQFELGATETNYMPYCQVYTDGTQEVITDNLWNTATAEMLLKVWDLADTQEVLSWNITRKVWIKVFDWTENWNVYSVTQWNLFRTILNDSVSNNKVQLWVLCNYYSVVDTNDRASGTLSWTVTNYDFINNDYTTLDEWKEYLYWLYANWTPVIIVYPLTTATTESVAWQELITKPITQTAWSISNMTITVTSDWWIPSPTTPKDIICNNWALRMSRNLFDKENTPVLNIAIQNWKYVSNSERYWVAIKVQPSTTYTFSFTQSVPRVFINIWLSDNAPEVNWNCSYLSAWTIDSYTLTTESTTQYVYIYTTNANFVNTAQFEPWSNATPYHEYWIYTEWDIETVEDEAWNTATAEMLLKIWDLVDTQEVLSGNITRKVWIKVFDWTETFQEYAWVWWRYRYTIALSNTPSLNWIAYSSHFVWWKTLAELNADTTITQAVWLYTNKLRFYTTTYETLSDFTSFLAQQYANWTPVIAIYTLATETTETVDWQNLNVKRWTNKIEITQASIDNLWISATYLSRE